MQGLQHQLAADGHLSQDYTGKRENGRKISYKTTADSSQKFDPIVRKIGVTPFGHFSDKCQSNLSCFRCEKTSV